LSFALKTRKRLRVSGYFLRQELEGYETVKAGVFGLVDHTHSAAAEFLNDAVVGNRLADHR
jgi:hypothetical protein